MAWTDRYVSADASGGDGLLITTPWTLAEAILNAAAGMRFNVKAGTYANTTTSRTFNVAGTAIAPIWWRGYNTTPGDIDANNSLTKPVISFTTGQAISSGAYQMFSNLDVTSAYVAGATGTWSHTAGTMGKFYRCRFTNTAANSNGRAFTGANSIHVAYCQFVATATAATVCSFPQGLAIGCSTRGGIIGLTVTSNATLVSCVADSPTTTGFSTGVASTHFIGCSSYNCTNGFLITSATAQIYAENCVASTCTNGIKQNAGTNSSAVNIIGCAFYSCTNPIVGVQECATAADDLYVARGNVTLTADPFVNAAGHDFTLNAASAARGAGIPGAFENESYVAYTDAGAVGNARTWKRAVERIVR